MWVFICPHWYYWMLLLDWSIYFYDLTIKRYWEVTCHDPIPDVVRCLCFTKNKQRSNFNDYFYKICKGQVWYLCWYMYITLLYLCLNVHFQSFHACWCDDFCWVAVNECRFCCGIWVTKEVKGKDCGTPSMPPLSCIIKLPACVEGLKMNIETQIQKGYIHVST
jgi:hypothetical protein